MRYSYHVPVTETTTVCCTDVVLTKHITLRHPDTSVAGTGTPSSASKAKVCSSHQILNRGMNQDSNCQCYVYPVQTQLMTSSPLFLSLLVSLLPVQKDSWRSLSFISGSLSLQCLTETVPFLYYNAANNWNNWIIPSVFT